MNLRTHDTTPIYHRRIGLHLRRFNSTSYQDIGQGMLNLHVSFPGHQVQDIKDPPMDRESVALDTQVKVELIAVAYQSSETLPRYLARSPQGQSTNLENNTGKWTSEHVSRCCA